MLYLKVYVIHVLFQSMWAVMYFFHLEFSIWISIFRFQIYFCKLIWEVFRIKKSFQSSKKFLETAEMFKKLLENIAQNSVDTMPQKNQILLLHTEKYINFCPISANASSVMESKIRGHPLKGSPDLFIWIKFHETDRYTGQTRSGCLGSSDSSQTI